MITTSVLDSKIDSYLARVRAALRGLPEGEIGDILRELQSHVNELAEAKGVDTALLSLGDPVDLAKTYRAANSITRAQCSGSPLVILQGLQNAHRSRLARGAVTALYVLGYVNVVTLWAAALDKLFAPSRVGLWYSPGHSWPLKLVTDGTAPAGARELLGWWLVPATVILGWLLRYLIDLTARWWIRRYRNEKEIQS